MKCSLLTLSTFIDGELGDDRASEVDAHIVGCPRCTTGAATLREERGRVGRLARVEVEPESARAMLEQVGITGIEAPVSPGAAWTAAGITRVTPSIGAVAERAAGPAAASWAEPPPPDPGVRDLDDSWPAAVSSDSWETDLPPPLDDDPATAEPWRREAPLPVVPPPLVSTPPPAPPSLAPAVPVRAPVAGGAAAVWTRLRDAVAVRAALARGSQGLEDRAEIVSGAPLRRGRSLPQPAPVPPEVVATAAAAAERLAAEAALQSSVELNGVRGVGLAPRAMRSVDEPPPAPATREPVRPALEPDRSAADRPDAPAVRRVPTIVDQAGWNAFAASSFPPRPVEEPSPATAPQRPMGRHSRAVARGGRTAGPRIGAGIAAAGFALAAGASTLARAARRRVAGVSSGGPDSRILAGVAAVGIVFVVALLIGHSSHAPAPRATALGSHSAAPTAHPTVQGPTPTPATSAPTAAATAPPVAQTIGSGATGFTVTDLRYGRQPSYSRMVIDLTGGSGTPRATVAFTDPRTVLVTLSGTAPPSSIAPPPKDTIISSVTLVSGSAQRSVFRLTLDRAATSTVFYLLSPTRFVLDLH